jgi:hypothetical protein
MQIVRECRLRAAILTELAKDAAEPELESQLLYVAQDWLTLASLKEQLSADAELGGSTIRL